MHQVYGNTKVQRLLHRSISYTFVSLTRFQMVALFLIGLVIAARTLAYDYTNIPILIGVAVVASFLFLVAVVGLFGAFKHHQVVLFFVSLSTKANNQCQLFVNHQSIIIVISPSPVVLGSHARDPLN